MVYFVEFFSAEGEMDFVVLIVAVREVLDDGVRFPEDEVAVIVIDDGGDTYKRQSMTGRIGKQ